MTIPLLAELIGQRCLACGTGGAVLCPSCRAHLWAAPEAPPPAGVTRACCTWAYEGPARALILGLKLRGLRSAAGPLADGMAMTGRHHGLGGGVVTWVPGRRRDIAQRGFDHAELLARRAAHGLGLPAAPLVRRRHAGRDQSALSARDRALNVAGAFCAARSPDHVVLVDDLVTTGATAAACAFALRAGGARCVELLAAARA